MPASGEITERLLALRGGDPEALNQLVPLVYERLRAMAHARLTGRRSDARTEEIVALDQALGRLGTLNERMVKMIELRFFAGLSIEETAEVLGLTARTVNRDCRVARALLYQALTSAEAT